MSDGGLTYLLLGNDRRYQELYWNNGNFKQGIDLMVRIIPVLVGVLADDSEKLAEIQKLMLSASPHPPEGFFD